MPYIKFAITSILVMVSVEGKSEKKAFNLKNRIHVVFLGNSFFGSLFSNDNRKVTPRVTPTPVPAFSASSATPIPLLSTRRGFLGTATPTPLSFLGGGGLGGGASPTPHDRVFAYTDTGTVTINPGAYKPPLNQPYADRLAFLSTLPLNQRLAYLKSNILRTGANALSKASNTIGEMKITYNFANLALHYSFLFKDKVGKIFAILPMICMLQGQLHLLHLQGQQGQVPFQE